MFDNITMSFLQELTPDQLRAHVRELDHLADYHTVVTLAQDIYGKEAPEHIYVSFEGDSDDEGGMTYHVSSWSVQDKDRDYCKPDLSAPFWHKPSCGWSKTTPLEDLEEKLAEREKESWEKGTKERAHNRQEEQRRRLRAQWEKEEAQKKQEYNQATNNRYAPHYSSFSSPFWRTEPHVPFFGTYPEETNHLYEAKRIELREKHGIEWPEIPLAPEPESCPLYDENTTREEALQELAEELMDDDYWEVRSERLSDLDEDRDEYTVSEPPKVSFPKVYAMIPTQDREEASVVTHRFQMNGSTSATGALTLQKLDVTLDAKDLNQLQSEKKPLTPEQLINYLSNAWGNNSGDDWEPQTSHVAFGNWMSACLFMRLCYPIEAQRIVVGTEDQSYYDDEGDYNEGPITLASIKVYDQSGKELFPDIKKPLCKYLLAKREKSEARRLSLSREMTSYAIYREMLNMDHLPITVPLADGDYDITTFPLPIVPKLLIP